MISQFFSNPAWMGTDREISSVARNPAWGDAERSTPQRDQRADTVF